MALVLRGREAEAIDDNSFVKFDRNGVLGETRLLLSLGITSLTAI